MFLSFRLLLILRNLKDPILSNHCFDKRASRFACPSFQDLLAPNRRQSFVLKTRLCFWESFTQSCTPIKFQVLFPFGGNSSLTCKHVFPRFHKQGSLNPLKGDGSFAREVAAAAEVLDLSVRHLAKVKELARGEAKGHEGHLIGRLHPTHPKGLDMYGYIYIYIYVCMYLYIYICICIYIYVCI